MNENETRHSDMDTLSHERNVRSLAIFTKYKSKKQPKKMEGRTFFGQLQQSIPIAHFHYKKFIEESCWMVLYLAHRGSWCCCR